MVLQTYVLQLDNDYWYVGKTHYLRRRFAEHKTGLGGARWTSLHKPVGRRPWYVCEGDQERKVTLLWMYIYGANKVRGYIWCKRVNQCVPRELDAIRGLMKLKQCR